MYIFKRKLTLKKCLWDPHYDQNIGEYITYSVGGSRSFRGGVKLHFSGID